MDDRPAVVAMLDMREPILIACPFYEDADFQMDLLGVEASGSPS